MNYRELLKDKKRVVIKVGSSSLIHKETNKLDLRKLEVLVRELSDLHNQGKDVVLVTSGAVAVGASAFGMHEKPTELKEKTGMLRSWTGASDDDLSETFFRVQPDGGADSDDKEYDGQ
ncbi:putative glutamate 5-kinase [Blautia obeum ATCC 29174]|uniref:Putative glutamate 5-kinase n=1 Tax=Blautia obeum ATCC 29174 TaxID=411459 RepID=A5ZYS4_9FIRM|nr:putative glutamate 5-kinase [Blautia obeum ATCC 29174]